MGADLRELYGGPSPRGVTPEAADAAVEACGCFDAARGPQRPRGLRVRLGEGRYFSCQYAALLRTGEASGWDAEIGREALYVVFAWGTLVVTGAGLAALDELLSEHRLARLSLGEGNRGVRVDEIRVVTREPSPPPPPTGRRRG